MEAVHSEHDNACFQRLALNFCELCCVPLLLAYFDLGVAVVHRMKHLVPKCRQSMCYCNLLDTFHRPQITLFICAGMHHIHSCTYGPYVEWTIQSKLKCMFEWSCPKVITNNHNISKNIKIKLVDQNQAKAKDHPKYSKPVTFLELEVQVVEFWDC